jgi:hypothetical protein
MIDATIHEPVALDARHEPVTLALPRISRQRGVRDIGNETVEIDARPLRDRRQERMGEHFRTIVLTLERRHDDARRDACGKRLLHVSAQDRMRGDLDEHAHAIVGQTSNCIAETDRLANVAPPVIRVERGTRQRVAGDRRYESRMRIARREIGQPVPHDRLDYIHAAAVERIVEAEQLIEMAGVRERRADCFERGLRPCERHRIGAVATRDFNGRGEIETRDPVARRGFADAGRRHPARAARQALGPAANPDHAHGLGERERARHPGRRDLADTVADRRIEADAARGQYTRDADLHREQQRLRVLGRGEPFGVDTLAHRFDERRVAVRAPQRIDFVERRAKHRILGIEPLAHAGPLTAVARVDERDGCVAFDGLPLHDACRQPALRRLRECGKRRQAFILIRRRDDRAMLEPLTTPCGGGRECGPAGTRLQAREIACGNGRQRGRRPCGEDERR